MVEGAFDQRLDVWKIKKGFTSLVSSNIKRQQNPDAQRAIPEDALAAARFAEQAADAEMATYGWHLYEKLLSAEAADLAKENMALPADPEPEPVSE